MIPKKCNTLIYILYLCNINGFNVKRNFYETKKNKNNEKVKTMKTSKTTKPSKKILNEIKKQAMFGKDPNKFISLIEKTMLM